MPVALSRRKRYELNAVAETLVVVLLFATLAQAWSWLGSYGGIVSLGNAVFFGIGGYAVAVSNFRGGSPWYGAFGGALFAGLAAAAFGGLFLRGRGYVFAALTLAAGVYAEPFVGGHAWIGPGNVFAFPVHRGFLNLQFSDAWPYALLALVVFAVTQALTFALRASRIGYYLRAVRANPVAARSAGITARPVRLLALAVSAFVTSVAGSLFAEYRSAVDPHAMFALALSFDIALIGAIAGPASAWGPPLAALVYVAVAKVVPLHPTGLLGDVALVAQGVLIVLIAWLRPGGLFPAIVRKPRPAAVRSAA